MSMTYMLAVLFLLTSLMVLVWAIVSKARLERRMRDPNAPRSTLASDVPSDAKPADV